MSTFDIPMDWHLDDGINLVMINDYLRNNFFEQCFLHTVAEKNCIDVGFGTGLLSILAIKHGAKHITAFESDVNRYKLGMGMISNLGLQDKIHLVNKRYTHTSLIDAEVLFTETFSSTLWGEGLLDSMPRHDSVTMIPDQCFCDIAVIPLSQALADRLMIGEHDPDIFDPLVDVDTRFVNFINSVVDATWRARQNLDSTTKVWQHWNQVLIQRQKTNTIDVRGYPQEIRDIYDKIVNTVPSGRAFYRVDCTEKMIRVSDANGSRSRPIDFADPRICLELDLSIFDSPAVLVVPRFGISFAGETLFLDRCVNWGLPRSRIYRVPYTKVKVSHDMSTSQLNFSNITLKAADQDRDPVGTPEIKS